MRLLLNNFSCSSCDSNCHCKFTCSVSSSQYLIQLYHLHTTYDDQSNVEAKSYSVCLYEFENNRIGREIDSVEVVSLDGSIEFDFASVRLDSCDVNQHCNCGNQVQIDPLL